MARSYRHIQQYHREFDSSMEYPLKELSEMMSFRECQADRGAAALLMPSALVRNISFFFDEYNAYCKQKLSQWGAFAISDYDFTVSSYPNTVSTAIRKLPHISAV